MAEKLNEKELVSFEELLRANMIQVKRDVKRGVHAEIA